MEQRCEILGLGIHVKVSDIYRSRAFYESLGFAPIIAFGDADFCGTFPATVRTVPENMRGVVFKIGDCAELEIADAHPAVPDVRVFERPVESPKISAMVRVKSLVPLFSNTHVQIKFPVRHYYWSGGVLEAAFRDPDGFVLVFIAPYSQAEFEDLKHLTNVEIISRDPSLARHF